MAASDATCQANPFQAPKAVATASTPSISRSYVSTVHRQELRYEQAGKYRRTHEGVVEDGLAAR